MTGRIQSSEGGGGPPPGDFGPLWEALRVLCDEQNSQGPLHARSPQERFREAWMERFWDVRLLPTFRSYRSPLLGGGTMRWPNRRKRYDNVDYRPSVFGRLRDWAGDVWGRRYLRRRDRELMARCPPELRHLISDTHCGQPFGTFAEDGRFLTEPVLQYGMFLMRLWEHLESELRPDATIVEIGGGLGGLARLLRLWRPQSRLVLVDFPEMLMLQAYYLMDAFAGVTVQLHDGGATPAADITLVPTRGIEQLDTPVDLFVNTHSFQEMTNAQVDYYLDHVTGLCVGWLYSVNRKEKLIGDEIVRNPRDRLAARGWTTIYEAPQRYQPHILEGLYRAPGGRGEKPGHAGS